MIFLFASLAISIGLQMILPFPYGLGAALAIFIALPLFMRRRYMAMVVTLDQEVVDSLEWVHKVAPAKLDTFALFVTTNTKEALAHVVVQRCNVLISR